MLFSVLELAENFVFMLLQNLSLCSFIEDIYCWDKVWEKHLRGKVLVNKKNRVIIKS